MAGQSSLLTPTPPSVAVELAHRRVTVVEVGRGGSGLAVVGYASEALPDEAIQPSLAGVNIPDVAPVADAVRRAAERAGVRAASRVALIVPDSIARVSLLPFEQMPAKAADVEQLVRWQLKKATPFPIEDAQVSWMQAHRTAQGPVLAGVVARVRLAARGDVAGGHVDADWPGTVPDVLAQPRGRGRGDPVGTRPPDGNVPRRPAWRRAIQQRVSLRWRTWRGGRAGAPRNQRAPQRAG